MLGEHSSKEERILIDPESSKSQDLPERSENDCAQIHSLTTQHQTRQGSPNSDNEAEPIIEVPTVNSTDISSKPVGDSGFPFAMYIEKGEQVWKNWVESFNEYTGFNKPPDKAPILIDVEGRIKLKGKDKETELIRKGLGLLMTRMLFGTFVLFLCYLITPIRAYGNYEWITYATIILVIAYCVATRYLHKATRPSAAPRVLLSSILWIVLSIIISLWTVIVVSDPTPIAYAMVLTAVISVVSMVYMRQKYIDFSFFRIVVLNSVIIEIAYVVTSTGSSYQTRPIELYFTALFVIFTVYIAYDMYAILKGKPQYSCLTLLASEWYPWRNTENENEDVSTSIYDSKEDCRNEKEDCHNEKEEKVAIDGNYENAVFLARKEFIRRGYIILIYFLIATQFIVTMVASRRSYINGLTYYYQHYRNTWTDEAVSKINLLDIISVTNIGVLIVAMLYYCYKSRHVAPKRWLIVLGVSYVIVACYVEDLMSEWYMYEPVLFALAMVTLVCMCLMNYMRRRRDLNGLKPYLIPVYAIQAVLILVYFTGSHLDLVYSVYAAIFALLFSLYLVWDAFSVAQGTPKNSLIIKLAGIDGTELPTDMNHGDDKGNFNVK